MSAFGGKADIDRHGYLGRLPPWSQGLGTGGTALGRHRPCHWACLRGSGNGHQRAPKSLSGRDALGIDDVMTGARRSTMDELSVATVEADKVMVF